MLVMRTISNPVDEVSGFTVATYQILSDIIRGTMPELERVQITSQVERTEPDGLVTEEYSEVLTSRDEDDVSEGTSKDRDMGEHTSMEGEDTGDMGTELEHNMDTSDGTTEQVDAGEHSLIGDDDQEDTRPTKEGCGPAIREDELDIQFVRVITT